MGSTYIRTLWTRIRKHKIKEKTFFLPEFIMFFHTLCLEIDKIIVSDGISLYSFEKNNALARLSR